jgi:hypothetical protein
MLLMTPVQVFLTLLISVIVYLVPAALISIDFSTAYPLDGGYVQWIDEVLL